MHILGNKNFVKVSFYLEIFFLLCLCNSFCSQSVKLLLRKHDLTGFSKIYGTVQQWDFCCNLCRDFLLGECAVLAIWCCHENRSLGAILIYSSSDISSDQRVASQCPGLGLALFALDPCALAFQCCSILLGMSQFYRFTKKNEIAFCKSV